MTETTNTIFSTYVDKGKARLLRPLYNEMADGVVFLGTPQEAAQTFSNDSDDIYSRSERLIAFYATAGGATGFFFGLPGYLLLPLTITGNILGTTGLQLHLCATIAALYGHDPQDAAVRDQCIECLLEAVAPSETEEGELATRAGFKLAERGVRFAAERGIKALSNSGVSALRLGGRGIPLLGGALGAVSDGYFTRKVGECARQKFAPAQI